jgi:hypothetical protein
MLNLIIKPQNGPVFDQDPFEKNLFPSLGRASLSFDKSKWDSLRADKTPPFKVILR